MVNYSDEALRKVRQDRLLLDALDRWLYEEVASYLGPRVLEIGCGHGNFARQLKDRELYIGTDVCEDSVETVRRIGRGRANVRAFVADATAVSFRELSAFRVQTVFSLNVFEHIDDHVAAFRNTREILEPGGHLVLVVPAHQWLYGSMDESIGHYRRYSKASMLSLFAETGFTGVRLKYMNALGALGWYVNGRLRKMRTPPTGQLKAFNRLVPLLQRCERVVPAPFGVSLLAVGARRER